MCLFWSLRCPAQPPWAEEEGDILCQESFWEFTFPFLSLPLSITAVESYGSTLRSLRLYSRLLWGFDHTWSALAHSCTLISPISSFCTLLQRLASGHFLPVSFPPQVLEHHFLAV